MLLALLDFLIDFVPVLLTGCATTLLENHFSDLKIKVLEKHLTCPCASPTTSCPWGEGTEPHPGQASPVLPPASGVGPPVSAPSTRIPLLGERRGLLARALGGT